MAEENQSDEEGGEDEGDILVPLWPAADEPPLQPLAAATEGDEHRLAAGLPPPPPPPPPGLSWVVRDVFEHLLASARARFLGRDPTFFAAFGPFALIALVLFSRWPGTNYIFDEQEALLANPYVNAVGGLRFRDAIHRDFWGLLPDRSIGSYRPIPNLLWRSIWQLSSKPDGLFRQPFVHHIYNVFFHAINAAIVTMIVWAWTRRRGQAWLAGLVFVTCAVLTEAVSGIVGIADVLGGMGALLALAALSLPGWAMPFAVFMAVSFGLFCKESALVCVPLVPFAALLVAPLTHPGRPARLLRAALAFVASAAAFYLYVELRKRWFPSPLPRELAEAPPLDASRLTLLSHDFLVWFHQAPLPKDPLNNPLVDADKPHRIAGALRVYFRGLCQLVFPSPLSGDYSFPQEPIPERLVFPQSVAGAALSVLPPLGSFAIWIVVLLRERFARKLAGDGDLPDGERAAPSTSGDEARFAKRIAGLSLFLLALSIVTLDIAVLRPRGFELAWRSLPLWIAGVPWGVLGLGLFAEGLPALPRPDGRPLGFSGLILVAVGITWMVVSFFPHSNIPVVLPTVRAERFWYFPAIGSAMVLAVLFSWIHEVAARRGHAWITPAILAPFFVFQGVQAYRHAMDYRSDVDFWRATKDAVPRSAKAHLNYSVMKGARGDLVTRLDESRIALSLAPDWAMAHIYTGDTLCRMHKAAEAWPYYRDGFDKGPNDQSLIALALQCLYDEKELTEHETELRAVAAAHEGSWIAYLATDTLNNHEKNKGVDPKYRPRGYNEGPKE
jgi:protein O-mannosyl-transferase